MDVISVPESGPSQSANGASGACVPSSHEYALLIVGFIILALSAALVTVLADTGFAQYARRAGIGWDHDLWPTIPSIAYLCVTAGTLRMAFKSTASAKYRWAWFSVSQVVSAGLLYASTWNQN